MIVKNQKEKTQKKIANLKKSDIAANRLYVLFFAAVLLIFGIVRVGNSITAQLKFINDIQIICVVVSAALLIAAIIYKFVCARSEKDETYTTFSSSFLILIAAAIFAVFTLFGNIDSSALLALVIIGTVLYFVYNIYAREFFWYSLYTALAYFVLALGYPASNTVSLKQMIISAAAIAVAIAVIAFVAVFASRKGHVAIFGRSFGKLSKSGAYPFYVTSALIIAGLLLALFISGISIYSLAVLFISYMIFAVIYTIKLM